jgi:uncharacterized membrane protein
MNNVNHKIVNEFYKILLISIIFIGLDFIYLNSVRKMMNDQIKIIQGSDVQMNLFAALLCYISLVFGIYYFIIKEKKSAFQAFLLGLVIYTVYEFTNWSIFMKWKPLTVLIDSLWGGILFMLTTTIVYHVYG